MSKEKTFNNNELLSRTRLTVILPRRDSAAPLFNLILVAIIIQRKNPYLILNMISTAAQNVFNSSIPCRYSVLKNWTFDSNSLLK